MEKKNFNQKSKTSKKKAPKRIGVAKKEMANFDITVEELDSIQTNFKY